MGTYEYRSSWCDFCKREEPTLEVTVYYGDQYTVDSHDEDVFGPILVSSSMFRVVGSMGSKKKKNPEFACTKIDLCKDCREGFLNHLELVRKGERSMANG